MKRALTPAEWNAVLRRLGVAEREAALWDDHFAAVIVPGAFSLGAHEVDDFLANVLHESNRLRKLEEDLFYKTPGRLMAVWPTRFKTLEQEVPYLRNPQKLAEKVYGGRMGNTAPGDAWAYRGSNAIQVTGKANFAALEAATGIPLVKNPDLLRRPGAEGLRVCVTWWEGNVPDAVMGDKRRVRKEVNGGDIGLKDVVALSGVAGQAMGVFA